MIKISKFGLFYGLFYVRPTFKQQVRYAFESSYLFTQLKDFSETYHKFLSCE